jgi:hypothetical protein
MEARHRVRRPRGGPDEVLRPVGEAEMTLIRVMRRIGISADDVIARITAITPLPRVTRSGRPGAD